MAHNQQYEAYLKSFTISVKYYHIAHRINLHVVICAVIKDYFYLVYDRHSLLYFIPQLCLVCGANDLLILELLKIVTLQFQVGN